MVKGLLVPCGKCPACLANNRQEWTFRLNSEYLACSYGLFVTLTYDDEHLPLDGVSKRDVQLFLKRLRKQIGNRSFRYFITAEYGDRTFRPHYHGLLFFSIGFDVSIYDRITSSWQNGFVDYGSIEPASVAYCTKYCMKQSFVPKGCNKTFRLMSKRPCLGSNYLDNNIGYHLETMNFSRASLPWCSSRLPRLFRDKMRESYNYVDYKFDCSKKAELEASRKLQRQYDLWCEKYAHKYATPLDRDNAFAQFVLEQKDRQKELMVKRIKKQKI